MAKEERTTSSTGGQKGVKLARFDLIPARPLWLLAEHYGKGAKKYAEHQWRQGYEWTKSISALERHLNLFKQGIDWDICSNEPEGCLFEFEGRPWDGPEDTCWNHTGSHHLQAVMWMSFSLMEFADNPMYKGHDDRYVPGGDNDELLAKALKDFSRYGVVSMDPEDATVHYTSLENPIYADNTECCGIPMFGKNMTRRRTWVTCPEFKKEHESFCGFEADHEGECGSAQ